MIIKKSAYNELINCKKVPPELGGILIGNAFVIDTVIFDIEKNNLNYTPNVDYLNSLIENNEIKGKHFWGMFHTHADNESNASKIFIFSLGFSRKKNS